MITEISTTGNVRRRHRWLDESLAVVRDVRAGGVPTVGYTWWPMFSLITWRYRGGSKATAAYLAHMGLWDLRDEDGQLKREATPLVEAFRRCVQTPP